MSIQSALQTLWTDRCTVTVKLEQTDPVTKRTEFKDAILFSNQPCRVSFKQTNTASSADGVAVVAQTVKLFLSLDRMIPPGSRIAVTRDDKTEIYVSSGQPAVYQSHQEIQLERLQERA